MNNCLSAGNIVGMEAIVTFPLSTPVEPMGKPGVPRPLD